MAQSVLKVGGAIQVGSLASAPSNPQQGMIYVDSSAGKVLIYDGSTFNEIQDEALLDAILGTLVGSPTNYTPSEATHSGHLQGIDTALGLKADSSVVSEIDQNVDDLITLSGVSENATNLGTFTGSTISDNQAIKAALQELETAVESASGADEKADDVFRVIGSVDSSKKLAFEVDGLTTSTTRTITMPDTDIDLADIATNTSDISTNASNISANTSDIADIRTTQGTSDGDTDLGTFTGSTISDSATVKSALQELETEVELKISSSEKGSANGVATLDGSGKLPSAQLPTSATEYKGAWNANTNSPSLADGAGTNGDLYRVSVSGSQDLGSGSISFVAGDAIIYNGSVWEKIPGEDIIQSVNGATGVVVLDSDDISEGASNFYYTETRFDSSFSAKDTDDLSEGSTNLYHTDARAKTAAVVNSTAGSETDQAPSVSSIKSYVASEISGAGHLSNISEDTTPELGGDLEVGSNAIEAASNPVLLAGQNAIRRAKQASKSNFVEEEYLHAVSLSASQTATVISALNFAHASVDAVEIVYKLKDSAGALRMGTLRVVTDGTNVAINDIGTELGDSSAIVFDAAINGANVEISYDSGANTATMRCDIKRMLV